MKFSALFFCFFLILAFNFFVSANSVSFAQEVLPPLGLKETIDLAPSSDQQQDVFGISTFIDGKNAMVGAPWDSDAAYRSGALYDYENKQGTWPLTKKLLQPTPSARAMFGSSVDANGPYIAVGAAAESMGKLYNTGAVYIFDRNTLALVVKLLPKTTKSGDFFGNAVHWLDDHTLAVGGHLSDARGVDSGSVSLFQKQGKEWKESQTLAPKALHAGSLFGNVLASSGDFLAVGAYGQDGKTGPGAGAVFVFKKDAKGTWKEQQTLLPDVNKAFTEFGGSVAMQGKSLMVGTPYEDASARKTGTVYSYIFDDTTGDWVLRQKINHEDKDWQGRFGGSLALHNNRLFVGAPFGVVYAYHQERYDTDWIFGQKFSKTLPDYQSTFPQTVSAFDNHFLVGIPVRQMSKIPAGAAHIFSLDTE